MKRIGILGVVVGVVLAMTLVIPAYAQGPAGHGAGFDQFGYNYKANIFIGILDGADRNLDGAYWGDTTQADWFLEMKWSRGWDDARFHGGEWTKDAWLNNHLKSPDGQYFEEYIVVWTGESHPDGWVYPDGGVAIWGTFKVTLALGNSPYLWPPGGAKAIPVGPGANK